MAKMTKINRKIHAQTALPTTKRTDNIALFTLHGFRVSREKSRDPFFNNSNESFSRFLFRIFHIYNFLELRNQINDDEEPFLTLRNIQYIEILMFLR